MPKIGQVRREATRDEKVAHVKAAGQDRDHPPPLCVACGGTGESSSGRPCIPCVDSGRVKVRRPITSIFDEV